MELPGDKSSMANEEDNRNRIESNLHDKLKDQQNELYQKFWNDMRQQYYTMECTKEQLNSRISTNEILLQETIKKLDSKHQYMDGVDHQLQIQVDILLTKCKDLKDNIVDVEEKVKKKIKELYHSHHNLYDPLSDMQVRIKERKQEI